MQEKFKDVVDKVWPKTKKELEKAIESAKKYLVKGEGYLKDVSEKGIEQTKKMSLSLKREKLYRDLGKVAADTAMTKWKTTKKITALVKEIKELNKQIKKIGKK